MGRGHAARQALSLLVASALAIAGCKVRSPGSIERAIATHVKLHLTVGGRRDRSPLAPSDDTVARGRRAFSAYCAACHGLDGQKTGVPFANAMSPPVPSLLSPEIQAYSDGQLKWVIENGLFPSGMPASRDLLSEEEMWRIVAYLRHLPAAGSLGDPPGYH